ncbi:hypothetical protein [Pseudothauera rhizosphaerae]|nr:hypothetical protein [Pseudothauera rhizosphaerae]
MCCSHPSTARASHLDLLRNFQSVIDFDAEVSDRTLHFEEDVRNLLHAARPDPAHARYKLAPARREFDDIMAAIKAGIVMPTTRAAL